MSDTILFISDLHLDAARPDITEQFLAFLKHDAKQTRALYILGDLFEVWLGDDDPDPEKARIQSALRELTAAGVACFVMHGNRDFLLGRRFLDATGARMLHDPQVVEIDGRRVLLLHGDLLCTDDHAYQRLRKRMRNPVLQSILRNLPLRARQALADKMRAGSKAHIEAAGASYTTTDIMDVNDSAVERAFRDHGVDLMIHGHTHRPAVHRLTVDGHDVTRIVLGDWYTQGSVLRLQNGQFDLTELPRGEL